MKNIQLKSEYKTGMQTDFRDEFQNIKTAQTTFSSNENNVFIGDNLSVMKNSEFVRAYENRVSLIYIDPPYNTKNTFSYDDRKKSNEWLDFMESRLIASKKFLKEGGVIFISIDDSEYASLKLLCDKVFDGNFIGTFITNQAKRSNAKLINTVHEYVLVFAKDIKKVKPFEILRKDIPEDAYMIDDIERSVKDEFIRNGAKAACNVLQEKIIKYCKERNISWLKNYSQVSDDGRVYFAKDLSTPTKPRTVNIPDINLYLDPLARRGWTSDKRLIELYNAKRLAFKGNRPYHIHYLSESKDSAPSILNFYSRYGTKDLKDLGLDGIFDTPKPVEMIKYFIKLVCDDDAVVMDYFAGCGSTAQAVYEINEEQNSQRRFVLIQIEEVVNKNTEVYEKCLSLGINPNIASILQKRLQAYLEKQKRSVDFNIMKL